jgi:hypothetical protein
MAGYELITTASCPRTAVFRGRGNHLAGTTDDGQPPRPAPITQTAKPAARSPTDLPKDLLSYGQGCRTHPCPGRCPRRPELLPARAGTRPGSIRTSPARKRRSHPNCAGCTTSRPAGSAAMPPQSPGRRPSLAEGTTPRDDWSAGGATGEGPGVLAAGANPGRLRGSSLPGRPLPRRPCACPGGGSGTGRTAGLRHPGPPFRR